MVLSPRHNRFSRQERPPFPPAPALQQLQPGAADGRLDLGGLLAGEDAAGDQPPVRGQRRDESAPGSGLGLSIVDELARAYGGSLVLGASETMGGLKVELTLPRAAA